MYGLAAAEHGLRGDLALSAGGGERLEADAARLARVPHPHRVTGREHVRVRRAPGGVDEDAVVAGQARRSRQVLAWQDPDPDDHGIARQHGTVGEPHPGDGTGGAASDGIRRGARADAHAVAGVERDEPARHGCRYPATEDPGANLDHLDVEPTRRRGGGHLEPDDATPHDDHPPRLVQGPRQA